MLIITLFSLMIFFFLNVGLLLDNQGPNSFFLFYFIKLFLVTIERKFGKKLKGKYEENGDEYREPFIEYYKNLRIKFKKFMLKIP